MPSEELRKRLEALNGKPLENVPQENTRPASADGIGSAEGLRRVDPAPRGSTEQNRVRVRAGRERGGPAAASTEKPFSPLEDCLPGMVCTAPGGRLYYHIDRALVDHAPWADSLGEGIADVLQSASRRSPLHRTDGRLHTMLFLDLETLGLHGDPLFLIGALCMTPEGTVRCRQLLARSYAEEAGVVTAFAEMLRDVRLLVTFNGASFDVPMLRARASSHGIPLPESWAHLDLCTEARRQYRRQVPNCKLQTLEQRICGRARTGDVAGAQIPRIYREFLRTGNATDLALVIHHNLLDLATTADLLTYIRV